MISEDLILKIKEENDIVDVISEYIQLKKSGRNYMGLCPFHNEKTPSFTVSREKQIFKCFGCGEAGNVITFIMKYRNLAFLDALQILADRVDIDISYDEKASKVYEEKNKLFKLNTIAARYYFSNLNDNKNIRNYFYNRGINDKTIKRFGLGYSYNSWDKLLKYLKSKGCSELDMLKAGLITKKANNHYHDRFVNRVMFPVFDYKGRVIGFGGRVLDNSKPKYLNSPETEIFKKGTNLYALNFAIKKLKYDYMIIVEGYMDCIALHQYGINNVVASLGTALTTYQAKLLKRYVNKVIISYDADIAGQTATLRGLNILEKEGLEVKVLTVPDGKDPDEYIRMHGKSEFDTLIKNALPIIEYKMNSAQKGINLKDRKDVIKYINKIVPVLAELDPIKQDIYVKNVSENTHVSDQAIFDIINTYNQKNTKKSKNMNIIDDNRQKLYLEPAYIIAERGLLNIIINCKKEAKYIFKNVMEENLIMKSHKKIYKLLKDNIGIDYAKLKKLVEVNCNDMESSEEFVKILEMAVPQEDKLSEVVNDYINKLKKYRLYNLRKSLSDRIKKCEEEGALDESIKLTKELMRINSEISHICIVEGGR